MEIVYPPVIALAKTMFRVLDLRIQIDGAHHIPATGGAVLASNHASYLDFIFCGLGAQPAKRLVRFMAKKSVFDHKVSGPLMRGMRHISVDRKAGTAAFQEAENALRRGEVVGVFPEATISESFTVKALKSGAARLAEVAEVPLIPMAVWGPHRLWTKGREKELTKRHVPVIISIGEPIVAAAGATADATTVVLRQRLSALLDRAQQNYPEQPSGPDDRWWLPAHLGGTAPRPEELGYPPRPEDAGNPAPLDA
ncbi:1-acyl-sn-glycerol-3-phosphate acyltransferase [Couchioplanes caeruleus]|uniref:lysophospholipid acyltransferase family protein n=1 Tax=Couchioplanes caeruleus TaxID=56438 RepID=UPI0020BEA433|nr:lysophospholipid acyltransferase family protein [Couchioplanes caeruleus]UQU65881.1 1-acyl-sn-glycerol-3-phosphate acyltransferase [Couchioplanes caeruleus]